MRSRLAHHVPATLTRRLLSTSSSSAQTPSFPLKHVTRSNFAASLSELAALIPGADFVAVDLEMSGVTSSPWRETLDVDSPDVRYLKVRDSASSFAVLQLGVCPFRWDPNRLTFLAHPHNFFLFPGEEEFLCQTASLDFLAKYQFDFNACIYNGVPYLSRAREEQALRELVSRYEKDGVEVEEDEEEGLVGRGEGREDERVTDVLFSRRMKDKLTCWRDVLLQGGSGNEDVKTVFYKGRPTFSLSGFTPHQIRMIQLVVKKHFKDLAFVRVDGEESGMDRMVVYTESKADKELLRKEVREDCCQVARIKITAAVGFRHVIDLLSSEKKLLVGHNCFLDIAHIYSKFLGPLPWSAKEFVSSVNKHFPYIVDTKILLNFDNILRKRMNKSSTSLSSAFSTLCPQLTLSIFNKSDFGTSTFAKVEVQVDDARSSIWDSGVKHEAGYDAFMTGCVFAQACHHLGIDFESRSPTDNLALHEKLEKHVNLLYLSWIGGDIINLRTGDRILESILSTKRGPKIEFENIVLIWRFPPNLKRAEITQCISKVFGQFSVRSVFRIDETAVFVLFSKAEFVQDFLAVKQSLESGHEAVSVLHPLWRLLEGGNTCAAGYETYREICSSPISKMLFADQAEAVGIKWKTKLVEPNAEAFPTRDVESFNTENSSETRAISTEITKTDPDVRSFNQSVPDETADSFYSTSRRMRAAI